MPGAPDHSKFDTIWVQPETWIEINYLLDARGDKHEFSFFLEHFPDALGCVHKMWVPKQRCSGTHTSPDLADVGNWLVEKNPRIIYWCHTHPSMSATPSSDDWDTFNHFTNPHRPVVMMIFARNDAREISAHVRFPIKPTNPEDTGATTFIERTLAVKRNDNPKWTFFTDPHSIDFKALLDDLDAKVSPFSYNQTHTTSLGATGNSSHTYGDYFAPPPGCTRGSGYWTHQRNSTTGRRERVWTPNDPTKAIIVISDEYPTSPTTTVNIKATKKNKKSHQKEAPTGKDLMEKANGDLVPVPTDAGVMVPVGDLFSGEGDESDPTNPSLDPDRPANFFDELEVAICFVEDCPSDPSWDQAAEAYWEWERSKRKQVRAHLTELLEKHGLPAHENAVMSLIPEKKGLNRYVPSPMRPIYFGTNQAPITRV